MTVTRISLPQTQAQYKKELDQELKTIVDQHGRVLKDSQREYMNKRLGVIAQEFRRMGGK
jgi:chemotaxis protein histidine kinase CheA